MAKTVTGVVVSTKMQNTIVVEVTRRVAHPLYKKLLKRSKKFKVETGGKEVIMGSRVTIVETKRMSKDKYYKLFEKEEKKTKEVAA